MAGFIEIILKSVGHGGIIYNPDNGELSLWKMPFFMMPMESFSFYQKKLIEMYGKEAYDVWYILGQRHGYDADSILLKKYGLRYVTGNYTMFAGQGDLVGVGTLKVVHAEPQTYYLRHVDYNSPLAVTYKKLFQKPELPVDHYLRGLSVGVLMALDGGKLVCVETQCIARGAKMCIFETYNESKIQKKVKNAIEKAQIPVRRPYLDQLLAKVKIEVIMNPGASLIRSWFNKNLRWKHGRFYIEGVSGLFTALYVLVIADKYFLKRDKKKYSALLKETGIYQGQLAVASKKTIPLVSTKELNIHLRKLNVYGFGAFSVLPSMSARNAIFIVNTTNNYAKISSRFFGRSPECIDFFLSGLLEGYLSKLLGKKLSIREVECVGKGSAKCLFEVKLER